MQQPHTSISISKILTSLLLLCTLSIQAQPRGKVIPKVEKDTTALFKNIAVSVDLVGVAQLAFGDYGQYEPAVRINLKDKYFPILELGYGKANTTDETTNNTFKTKAPYGRIGIDFNLLKNKHDIYRLYGGVRYAFTSYKYDIINTTVTDPVWKDQVDFSYTGEKENMHWLELGLGVDAKIAGPLHLGWSVRYKRRLIHSEGAIGNSWYAPGFGRNEGSHLGGTFNVILEF